MSLDLAMAIAGLKREEALAELHRRMEAGGDPLAIVDECRRGMAIVGERFQLGEYYLAELLLAAEIFKEAVAIIEPQLAGSERPDPVGKVVLATMRGDIHDLGKNILATLLRARAFEVHDLGVDVNPDTLLAAVEKVEPDFVGLSVLITTTFDSMKEAVEGLGAAGLRDGVKLMIGGGVTTTALRDYLGADFQSLDASAGVEYCLRVLEQP